VARAILERFFREPDRSRFALMNAVTSVARDTADPELRWRLEEMGGGIPVGRAPGLQPDDRAAVAVPVGRSSGEYSDLEPRARRVHAVR
jgi:hypothetical protein